MTGRRARGVGSLLVAAVVALALAPVPALGAQPADDGPHQVAVPPRTATAAAAAIAVQPKRPPIEPTDFAALLPTAADALHVKLDDGGEVRVVGGRFVGLAAADAAAVDAAMATAGATAEPLFGRNPAALDAERAAFEAATGTPQVDLTRWYRVALETPAAATGLAEALNAADGVEAALAEPPVASAALPAILAQASPDHEAEQLHLDPAPAGIDADYAWTIAGGTGAASVITDIEYSWRTSHEDLTDSVGTEIPNGVPVDPFVGVIPCPTCHGTASLGLFGAEANGFGVTGVAPDAPIQLVNVYTSTGQALTNAIDVAAANSGAGDVILLEQQVCPVAIIGSACPPGWLPVEWFPSYYDAIVAAVGAGIHVVEAGGNGGRDVDPELVFDDSGAIIVGAGNKPGCTDFGAEPSRGRLGFSNYGERIDVQSHGGCVWTTGSEGDFSGPGPDPDTDYTAFFSGTSSASAIVAGAVSALASISETNGDPLAPNELRALLRATGTPQDTTADSHLIGPQPDLRAAITSYLADPHPGPANDDFFAPTVLTDVMTTVDQTTAGASVQVGEPVGTCGFPDRTVWFEFVAPATMDVTISVGSSTPVPSLGVWWRESPDILTQVGCSAAGVAADAAAVDASLRAGERYHIQVGATGAPITLEIGVRPRCDLDGDGYGDVLIGVGDETIKGQGQAGAINVFYGHGAGDPDDVPLLSAASAGVGGAAEFQDHFGYALACGDIDGDGYDDALVGIPNEGRGSTFRNGAVQVFYGGPSGISGADDLLVSAASGSVPGAAEDGDLFGQTVALGDFNGDGYADAAIGGPGETIGHHPGAGMVTILFGSASGLDLSGGMTIHQNKPGVPGNIEDHDQFGGTLETGDITGDGYDDLVIAAEFEALAGLDEVGGVVVVPGGPSGPDLLESEWVAPTKAFVPADPVPGLRYGMALALGDITRDGILDLAIGTWGGESVDVFAGSVAGFGDADGVAVAPGTGGLASGAGGFGRDIEIVDMDLDGAAELYIGVSLATDAGASQSGLVHVVEFDASLAVTAASVFGQATPGVAGAAEIDDQFGRGLTSEDIDADGFPDLFVGVFGETVGGDPGAGMLALIPGSATGLDFTGDRLVHQGSAGVGGAAEPGDGFAHTFG